MGAPRRPWKDGSTTHDGSARGLSRTGLEIAVGAIFLFVALLLSVVLHEFGHFYFPRRFKVPVSQFMAGFGTTVFSKKICATEVGLKALPLGGYIRMKGIYPDAQDDDAADMPGKPFFQLPAGQKIIIMAAGPAVNFVLALILLLVGYWGMGSPAVASGEVSPCTPRDVTISCTGSAPASPASNSLQSGDVLVAINGKRISSWNDVVESVRQHPNERVVFDIDRNGVVREVAVTLTQTAMSGGTQIRYLGVTPYTTVRPQTLEPALDQSTDIIGGTVKSLARVPETTVSTLVKIVPSQPSAPDRPLSLLGFGQVAGAVAGAPSLDTSAKLQIYVLLAAQLNLALFFVNLFPLPPFDGGHIAAAVYQGARDRFYVARGKHLPAPVSIGRLIPLTLIVLSAFLAVGAVFLVAEIISPIV
ncbi:M50 family metallopeptidase [Rathayibacter toxicus]|uniref:M50 family metallopeptidase n=1 Tax=Rathayibacter toxicus TaxID=145458 RepID=UPI00138B18FE|nr:M50 family metallopeptidase [Rathayibacter toxicus]QOD11323.1 site-2 protease family protein [Rathayibacter toxicus]